MSDKTITGKSGEFIVSLPAQQITGPRDFTWRALVDCELVDVRLIQVEGDADICFVIIGCVFQSAFRRRPRLVRRDESVRVQVESTGRYGAQCAVEIVYRPLFQDRVEP